MTQWILTGSLLILAVLLIRVIGRDRLSARVRYALWALVLVRLLLPFSVGESVLSVQNLLQETEYAEVQTEPILISDIIETTQTSETIEIPMIPIAEGESSRTYIYTPALVWGIGIIITASVFIISNFRFAAQLRRSRQKVMHRFVPVYVTEAVETPCLFGLWKPAIYVTPEVWENKTALRHVLAHELTHYRHKDHIWSVLRCVCVTLHWYNPLVWIAAILSQKDAELACDEGTLRQLGEHERTDYAKTLVELTCVGYKGMLTAATSMTGSDSDLKQRVLRIVKNPKMSAIAVVIVLVAAILLSLTVFTAAKAPAIEGVWRMELTHLGVGVEEPESAYMEYEFYDGVGRLINYAGEDLFSAETYRYTVDGDTVEIVFGNDARTETFQWDREGATLILGRKSREMTLTRVEREKKPYLFDGFNDIYNLTISRPNEEQYAGLGLNETQCAQLLELLREGEVTGTHREVADNMPYMVNFILTDGEKLQGITIANGLVYSGNKEVGYVLSNIMEIEAFLDTLGWSGQLAVNLETDGFVPADMVGIDEARMIMYGKAFYADPAQLAFLEELLSTAEEVGYPTACPFEGILEVKLSDGRVLGITPALDSCAVFKIGDTYYEYGNQFAYDDEGSYDNTALLAAFGLDHMMLEEMWAERHQSAESEVLGTNADIGDVVREQNDVMEPTYLSDEAREAVIVLLAQGIGEAIEGEFVYDTTYFTIFSSGQDTEDGFVLLSDNGSLSMDGVVYELSTGQELLRLLDAFYHQIRITVGGYPVTDLTGVIGEFLYPELGGVPENAEILWSSDDEAVCTVTGDAYGAEIYITGVGEAAVIAEYTENGNRYGYSVRVCGKEP